MVWREMHLFAHEILSKFQVFEVKQIQGQVCICMVSAKYRVCSCETFCNYKEFTFF